jgi:hypothetical protein
VPVNGNDETGPEIEPKAETVADALRDLKYRVGQPIFGPRDCNNSAKHRIHPSFFLNSTKFLKMMSPDHPEYYL